MKDQSFNRVDYPMIKHYSTQKKLIQSLRAKWPKHNLRLLLDGQIILSVSSSDMVDFEKALGDLHSYYKTKGSKNAN